MPKNSGFIIKDLAEFGRVTIFDLPSDIILEQHRQCPACDTPLQDLVALIGLQGKQKIRVGVCPHCGYVGFIDRPSKEWMVSFYASTWDAHIAKTVAEVRAQPLLTEEKKASRRVAGELALRLPVDRNQPMVEMGSGYGSILKYFKDSGFTKVFGTENSYHRAEIVSQAHGVQVIPGNFESSETQDKLSSHSPFGLIFSHHVFEHVYAPAEVIERMARLQQESGFLVFALPNVIGEHTGYKTLYLPHLHGFTKESLELLLNRFGYEIIEDVSPDDSNMIIAARRVVQPKSRFALRNDYYESMLTKFRKGLALDQLEDAGLQEYWWQMDVREFDKARIKRTTVVAWYWQKFVLWLKAKFRRIVNSHPALVEPLKQETNEAPIEIHYTGVIKLLMK